MAVDKSSAAATVDAATDGAAAAAGAGGPLPRVVALGDSVLFWWCGRIVSLARGRGTLEAGDAAAAMPPGSSADIKAQLTNGPPWVSATAALASSVTTLSVFGHHRRWLALRAALAFLVLGLRLSVPLMLRGFVRFLNEVDFAINPHPTRPVPPPPRPPLYRGWLWAAGLVLMSLAAIALDALSTWNTQAHTNTLRMQLGAALSAKALRLTGAGFSARFGAGRLLNAFSSDARRVSELNMVLEFLVTAPLVTAAAFAMISMEVGVAAAAAGVAVYPLALPLVFWWSSLIAALRQQSAAAADERLRLLGECLAGVAAVKALRAERDIEARIQEARAREMRALHKIAMLKALNYSLQYITTPIAALLLFTTAYVLNPDVDGGLNDAAIFYSLSLLALPEFYLLRMFVRSWQRLQEARTSAARIDDILSAPEPPPSASEKWLAAAAAAAGGGGKGAPAAGTGPLPLRGTVELRGGRYGWPGGALSAAAAADAAPGHGGARSDAGTDAAASDGGGGGDDVAGGSYGIDMQPAFSFVSKASSDPRGGDGDGGGTGGVAIHDMELLIRPGQLLGICGSTGAGKSSLLACLLGELEERSPGSTVALGGAAVAASLERAASAAAAAGGLGGVGGAAGAGRAASAGGALGGGDGDGRGGKDAAAMGDLFSSDEVVVAGRTALVSQQPWVAFGTLRDNITLGAPEGAPCAHGRAAARRERRVLATIQAAPSGDPGGRHGHHGRGGSGSGSGSRDAERKLEAALYNSVVEACALTNDLLTLAAGDLTPLGDGGSSLSGGQAARLALARSAFSRADVQLLDDPLSAVDPKVAAQLFERCIGGPAAVMKGATRLLVTHQVQFLPRCDRVAVLRDGRLIACGTWRQIVARDLPELRVEDASISSGDDDGDDDGAAADDDQGRPPRAPPSPAASSAAPARLPYAQASVGSGGAAPRRIARSPTIHATLSRAITVEQLFASPGIETMMSVYESTLNSSLPSGPALIEEGDEGEEGGHARGAAGAQEIAGNVGIAPADGSLPSVLENARGAVFEDEHDGDEDEDEEGDDDDGDDLDETDDGTTSSAGPESPRRGPGSLFALGGSSARLSLARGARRSFAGLLRLGSRASGGLERPGSALLRPGSMRLRQGSTLLRPGSVLDPPRGGLERPGSSLAAAAAAGPSMGRAHSGLMRQGGGLSGLPGALGGPRHSVRFEDVPEGVESEAAPGQRPHHHQGPDHHVRFNDVLPTIISRDEDFDDDEGGGGGGAAVLPAEGGSVVSDRVGPAGGGGLQAAIPEEGSEEPGGGGGGDDASPRFIASDGTLLSPFGAPLAGPAASGDGAPTQGAGGSGRLESGPSVAFNESAFASPFSYATEPFSVIEPLTSIGPRASSSLGAQRAPSGAGLRGQGTFARMVSRGFSDFVSKSFAYRPQSQPVMWLGPGGDSMSLSGAGSVLPQDMSAPLEGRPRRGRGASRGRGGRGAARGSRGTGRGGRGRGLGGPLLDGLFHPGRGGSRLGPGRVAAQRSEGSGVAARRGSGTRRAAPGHAPLARSSLGTAMSMPVAARAGAGRQKQAEASNWIAKPQLALANVRQEEDAASGGVAWRVYGALARHSQPIMLGVALFSLVISPLVALTSNLLLAQWVANAPARPVIDLAFGLAIPVTWQYHWVVRYAGLVVATVATCLLGFLLAFAALTRGAGRTHGAALRGVLHAPLSFFASNAPGSILNRFSGDQRAVDDDLPETLVDLWAGLMTQLSNFVLAMVAFPPIAAAILPALAALWWLRTLYVNASAQAQRLEAAARSPVLARMRAMVEGLVTIRAFGAPMRARIQDGILDAFCHALEWSLATRGLQRWLGVRLESLVLMVTAVMSFAAMGLITRVAPTVLGLALTKLSSTMGALSWVVRQSAELENSMTSVERMLQYAETISEEQELKGGGGKGGSSKGGAARGPRGRWLACCGGGGGREEGGEAGAAAAGAPSPPPPGWPRGGGVEFQGVWARYRPDLRPVLAGVDFRVEPGQMLGVVGRTGSGKSTLLLALFRLLRIEAGRILLDGADVSSVPVDTLRGHLALIPQAPLLFTGTVRANLDPTGAFEGRGISDAAVWALLRELGLAAVVRRLGGLDAGIAAGGTGLALGHKQLFSLVRALLRGAYVLAIDEGTANLDASTDATIQRTLHRLRRPAAHPAHPAAASLAGGGPDAPQHGDAPGHAARSALAGSSTSSRLGSRSGGSGALAALAPAGCSLIVVAHRLDTVAHADNLLVMSQGRVLEQGPPSELAKAGGVYAAMRKVMEESEAAAAAACN